MAEGRMLLLVLLVTCSLQERHAKEIQCAVGNTTCDSSMEYCDEAQGDCKLCWHACKADSGDCERLCPEYYGSVTSGIGYTTQSRKDYFTTPSDEEGIDSIKLISILFPLLLITMACALGIMIFTKCRKKTFKLQPKEQFPAETLSFFVNDPSNEYTPWEYRSVYASEPASDNEHSTFDAEEVEEPLTEQQDNEVSSYTHTTTLDETAPSLGPFKCSADESPPNTLRFAHVNQGFVSETSDNTGQPSEDTPVKQPYDPEDVDSETPVKQPYDSEDLDLETAVKQLYSLKDGKHEETAIKGPHDQEDIHLETPVKQPFSSENTNTESLIKQHRGLQNTDPQIREVTFLTPQNLHMQQSRNPTTSNETSCVNSNYGNPVTSDIEHIPTSNQGNCITCNHANPVTSDAEQIPHDHHNHHQSASRDTTSSIDQSKLSLREDPPGIRDLFTTLNLRNPQSTPAHNQYANESISLDNGSYSGPSFSMPSSAGVERSLNEEDEEYIRAQQQNANEAPPLNAPDDTESRYLHTRVLT